MHIQLFKIISQNPEYVENFCKIGNISFHFPILIWFIDNQSPEKLYLSL